MKPFTVFDLINDNIIWYGDRCGKCAEELPSQTDLNIHDIVMWIYNNSRHQVVCIAYHADCWLEWANTMKKLGKQDV